MTRLIICNLARVLSSDENFERYEPRALDRFEFFRLHQPFSSKLARAATLSMTDKIIRTRAPLSVGIVTISTRLCPSVGGCAHTCVGGSSGKVKEEEGETTIPERGGIPCAQAEIFFFGFLSSTFAIDGVVSQMRYHASANAPAEVSGEPSSSVVPALSTKNRPRTSARYARLSNVDLVKADRSPILAEKIPLYSSYLSTRARSRKVAFRAHLSAIYLSHRRDKSRSPATFMQIAMRVGKRARKCP